MSDQIKHECGIALIRLLKPLEFYLSKYGTTLYGINKLHLLMEKQHNRGQDGAGIACVKLDPDPGSTYIDRVRSASETPLVDIFQQVFEKFKPILDKNPERLRDAAWLKKHVEFTGELFLGHLRYGTYGKHGIKHLHPVQRYNNWMTRNLVLAGNFNLTNVDELFQELVSYGQYPTETSDTITILEKIGNYLDEENEQLYQQFRQQGYDKKEITNKIIEALNIQKILSKACISWDGGYTIAGLFGHGDAFVLRDPNGIRPAFFFYNDEFVVAASERPVIQTAFNIPFEKIEEVDPGHALIIKKDGRINQQLCITPGIKKSCSFERIYFSRGTDVDIYRERKKLGSSLAPAILKAINYDLANTVFSYIPNTAVDAFNGLIEELNRFCNQIKRDKILGLDENKDPHDIDKILSLTPRVEKVAVKDVKIRTFISQDTHRDDLVTHIYDITYGSVQKGIDSLVVIDDSIVRGTTLKKSIIRILDRLGPVKIIVASSAPQIRYPDCYGIDMAKISDFIAFQAAIELLREKNMSSVINDVYRKCKELENKPKENVTNHVRSIYAPFTMEQISDKISEMLTPPDLNASIQIVYQTIEDLHSACPNHLGDWYFTGDYPTPGGNRVVNKAFINYIEGKNVRAY